MPPQQVFVIWTHPLFQKSLTLLLDHPEIEIVGETCNYESAPQHIEKLRPNTVLIEETGADEMQGLISSIYGMPWDMRILFMNLMDNQLNFYHHERLIMSNIEDLVQIILNEMR